MGTMGPRGVGETAGGHPEPYFATTDPPLPLSLTPPLTENAGFPLKIQLLTFLITTLCKCPRKVFLAGLIMDQVFLLKKYMTYLLQNGFSTFSGWT